MAAQQTYADGRSEQTRAARRFKSTQPPDQYNGQNDGEDREIENAVQLSRSSRSEQEQLSDV